MAGWLLGTGLFDGVTHGGEALVGDIEGDDSDAAAGEKDGSSAEAGADVEDFGWKCGWGEW
jgi:hypothetical protein